MAVKKKKAEVVETEDKIIKVQDDESPRFSFDKLVASNRYKKYAYLLDVKLDKDTLYTLAEVDKIISEMI